MNDPQIPLIPENFQVPQVLGITIDDPWNTRNVVAHLKNLERELGRKVFVRVVFDLEVKNPKEYVAPLTAIRPFVSGIMGEILDSFYIGDLARDVYIKRAQRYLDTLAPITVGGQKIVSIWEQNEVNGEWTGKQSDVIEKVAAVHGVIHTRGERSAICLYDDQTESWEGFSLKLPPLVRGTVDWVLMSSYPHDNEGWESTWFTAFDRLSRLYPSPTTNFLIGECGMDPEHFEKRARAQTIQHYYGQGGVIRTRHVDRFIGGGFEWYQADILPPTAQMHAEFVRAVKA